MPFLPEGAMETRKRNGYPEGKEVLLSAVIVSDREQPHRGDAHQGVGRLYYYPVRGPLEE
jgi:hypothetical protein